jgi:hypothetical protein
MSTNSPSHRTQRTRLCVENPCSSWRSSSPSPTYDFPLLSSSIRRRSSAANFYSILFKIDPNSSSRGRVQNTHKSTYTHRTTATQQRRSPQTRQVARVSSGWLGCPLQSYTLTRCRNPPGALTNGPLRIKMDGESGAFLFG